MQQAGQEVNRVIWLSRDDKGNGEWKIRCRREVERRRGVKYDIPGLLKEVL